MRKLTPTIITVFLVLITFCGYAQSKLNGEVVDEADKMKLANATVMLLQAKDSILIDFTRTNEQGKFILTKPDTADFLLIVSYPKFGDFAQPIEKGQKDMNVGQIGLSSIENLIEEVLVTGRIPVVIKGDTVEYDAGSFTVEKNAKVEDLLRVLPGITVDANGKITAQGKTVEKVLVDGEEFFGNDPTLVTRNIRSDMVDKVQVYEKKSEQAERTGVDDGERIQTINVKLKEDAKQGMFGKIEGAAGTDRFYLGKAAINKFKGSQKIGAFALGANDGTVNLNWDEEEKFGMSTAESGFTDDGGMYFMGGSWDEFSHWNGRGRPKAFNTGISFIDSWNEAKHKLNFNYKYGRIENDEEENTISQNNFQTGIQNTTSGRIKFSENEKHRFNGKYDWNLDSLTTLTVKLSGSRGKTGGHEKTDEITTNAGNNKINENDRYQSGSNESSDFSYDGYLTRKFKKMGRSISFRLGGNVSETDGESTLKSKTSFYQSGIIDSISEISEIDQLKDNRSRSNNVSTSLTYTEPISTKINSSIGYEFNNSRTSSINNSFNNDGNGVYNDFDEEFSNDFDFNTTRNSLNLSLNYKVEKFEANFTNNFRKDDMFQRNNYENSETERDFLTYNPSVRLRYNFSKNTSVNFNYQHSNTLPSLTQIQPLRQNTNPLNIIEGNEGLTPARNDNFNMYFTNYNMLKGKYIYANVGLRQTRNSIQQNVIFDQDRGVRTLFYDNMKDHVANSGNVWMGGGFDLIKKHKVQARVGTNGNFNDFYSFLNGDLNRNTNYNYGVELSLQKNTTKNIDFDLSFNPGWRNLKNSLQPEFNSSGFTYESALWFRAYLPWKFQLYGDASYYSEAATTAFNERFDRLLIKPGISRKFLKSEALVVDVYVNDLLNQNVGFSRAQSGNLITQSSFNTISRYFMFKVSWDFTSMKGARD